MLYFRILSQDMNCVAAIGVVHFSVRGFGCALFYFRKEYENMKAKKFLAVAIAVALVISLTACAGTGNEQASSADKNTSDITNSVPSSVDEHTSTESVEETSSGNDNANDESTITESPETSVADTTSSIPMKEEKIEERDVYDEDGNVVDKIKVKVVDGVTYTVEDKSNEQHIIGEVPLYANEPEFPYGEAITLAQIMAAFKGCNVSQQEIFEKYVKFYDPSDWYEEDGIKMGPSLEQGYLICDPRKERENTTFTNATNEMYYTMKILDEKGLDYYQYKTAVMDVSNNEEVKEYIDKGEIAFVTVDKSSDYDDVCSWVAVTMGKRTIVEVYNYKMNAIILGYKSDKYVIYNPIDQKLYYFSKIRGLRGM